ncbi:unnamed protein product [Candidula unifasciata]|uniref:Ig-like domain-containing protein n=1 Tax=Candidula unifasciata TaxID=100452 RepID=A0A8S3Z041_9EUPU|nr:unnamed protein product [Candidula unifasciata]
MCRKIELWCVFYCFAVVSANEIRGFHINHTINFIRDQVLADFEPELQREKPSYPPAPYVANDDDVKEDMPAETRLNRVLKNSTTALPHEDPIRSAAIIGSNEATTSKSTETSAPDRRISDTDSIFAYPSLSPLSSVKEMPPHIRFPYSPQRVIVMEYQKKHYWFSCMADGHPEIEYRWLKDDKLLDDTDPYIKDFKNGSLLFTEFSDREDGMFQCFAKNKYGTSLSVKVPLIFEKPPQALPSGVPVNQSYVAIEGEPQSFACADTLPTVPEYTKRWYLLTETSQLQLTDRLGTDTQGVLRFSYVEPADATSYICALAPEVAAARDSIRLYNSARLTVQKRDKIFRGPKLAYSNRNVKAVLGSRAILECFFSGYPTPKITWKQGNQAITDSRFKVEFGRRLFITDVRESDAGTFTCDATNGYGTVKENVILNVTAPPQKVENGGLETTVKPAGSDVVLKCKGRAVNLQHLDTPIWFRNGQPLDEKFLTSPEMSSRYFFTKDRTELHISNLNKELDTACYQCSISNSEGSLFYDGYLKVIDALKVTQRPEAHIIASQNSGPINITVKAQGDSCCSIEYKWQFNGSAILEDEFLNPPFSRDSSGDIMFDPSTVDNNTLSSRLGNYSCRISDNYQDTVVSFVISMTASNPENLIDAGTENISLWWVGLLCGILFILIAIVIIIVVVKSNFPRNTYPLEKNEIKYHLNPEQDLLNQSFQEF